MPILAAGIAHFRPPPPHESLPEECVL